VSEKISPTATATKQILLARRSPYYWRVTFDHPPLNIFGPETIPQSRARLYRSRRGTFRRER